MADVKIVEGKIFTDHRGQISSVNNFLLDGVKRTYFIHHPDTSVIRGWHAHRYERKWFYCVTGEFILGLTEIDDFEHPSEKLQAQLFHLSEKRSRMVCVPAGYANWMKAKTPGAVLMIMSDKTLAESAADSHRYPPELWIDQKEVEI